MNENRDWTGHVYWRASEPEEELVRSRDWTGAPIVTTRRRRDRGSWIGPAIAGCALAYAGGAWYAEKLLDRAIGESWPWIPPLFLFTMIIPVPFLLFMFGIATSEHGLMTPLGLLAVVPIDPLGRRLVRGRQRVRFGLGQRRRRRGCRFRRGRQLRGRRW